jgi:transposase-like protein
MMQWVHDDCYPTFPFLSRLPLSSPDDHSLHMAVFRFCLSFRDVQELMLERSVEVSHETIRLWTLKFGAEYARRLRRRKGRCGDTWYLDEVFCKINGQQVYLWRAVDQDREVLDILVQKRRNAKAAKLKTQSTLHA